MSWHRSPPEYPFGPHRIPGDPPEGFARLSPLQLAEMIHDHRASQDRLAQMQDMSTEDRICEGGLLRHSIDAELTASALPRWLRAADCYGA